MMREDNAVQVQNVSWNGLQTVGEDDWRLLLEMFLNSQDISEKSRQTYSWALMRYFDWLRVTGRRLSGLTPADIVGYKNYLDYITLNVPPRAFSNVPLQIWSLSVRQSYYYF